MIVLSAIGIGIFEIVGSFGAAHDNDTGRKGMDALAIVLILLGPLALAVRDRWPLGAVAVTLASAAVYVGLGYVYGPIFVSIVVALIYAVLRDRRRGDVVARPASATSGSSSPASSIRAGDDAWLVKYSLVAGWMIVVLVVAELIRSRRDVLAQRATVEAEAEAAARGRAAPRAGPGAARRARPPHLTDQRPGGGRPAPHRRAAGAGAAGARRHQGGLAARRCASCAGALDILRRGRGRTEGAGADAGRSRRPRRRPFGPAGSRCDSTTDHTPRPCRRRSSWPPTASCRRR